MAEPIERPSETLNWVNPRNHVLDGEQRKNGSTDRDVIWVLGLSGLKEPGIGWGQDPPHGNGQF